MMFKFELPPLDFEKDIRSSVLLEREPLLALTHKGLKSHLVGLRGGGDKKLVIGQRDTTVGAASLADGPVLIWVISVLVKLSDTPPTFRAEPIIFRPGDVLGFLGKPSGGRQIQLLRESFRRLSNTMFSNRDFTSECLLNDFQEGHGRENWSVMPPNWLYDQVTGRHVLKITPAMVNMKGLERRVMGWAHVHCRRKDVRHFRMSLNQAYWKSGSHNAIRKFIHELRELTKRNPFPDYDLSIVAGDKGEDLLIARRGYRNEPHMPTQNDVYTDNEIPF